MKEIVLKYALLNAVQFNSKVNSKVVLGAVLKEKPEMRSNVNLVVCAIDEVIVSFAGRSVEDLRSELRRVAPELLELKPKEEVLGPLKVLPNAHKGSFVVRIAPSPSGPLHIGHAYGTSLNYEYAKMYGGKLVLRIEDTNPENIYPPAYDLIERDVRWLTDNGLEKEVIVQSDRLGLYYDCVEKLILLEKVYVCMCDADVWRELKGRGVACPCRSVDVVEIQNRWSKMFGEYAEGEAVVRLKTNIADKNPAMRDFAIMRIVEHVHPKRGKTSRLWPLMVLSVAIDDHEMGVTHVLNGKDHADNAAKEKIIMGYLGWVPPEYKHWGRINFEGFRLSTSKTRVAIEQGEYTGWEDIRLQFMPALRKRGYQPGAFRRFALEIGLSLSDKTVTLEEFWKNINAFNKEIIDSRCRRAFFVANPQKKVVRGAPTISTSVPVHPSFPERGGRNFEIGELMYISQEDLDELSSGKIHRFIEGYNFTVNSGELMYHSRTYEEFRSAPNKGSIIHYLSATGVDGLAEITVCMIDGTVVTGLGESGLLDLPVGEIVQFERCHFARLDSKNGRKLVFWYLHE